MHTSVKMEYPCEPINITPINPLISKCQIKVCYVSDQPNRNKSIITKEVGRQLANSLPGSPIVGYYNKNTQDFEEHSRDFEIKDGKIKLVDITQPYGFIDLNAKPFFQKYLEDGIEREYLVVNGYLWTGQYEGARKVMEGKDRHSMELDEKTLQGNWTKDDNGKPQFFIINEAIISKLCILGEEFEPCFEGANIKPLQFSLEDDFKAKVEAMIEEIQYLLSKGGTQVLNGENLDTKLAEENLPTPENENVETDFSKKDEEKEKEDKEKENTDSEDKDTKSEDSNSEDKVEEKKSDEKPADEPEDKKDEEEKEDKKKKYSLDEIPEYVELATKFADLEARYNALSSEIVPLREFKTQSERAQKEEMIKKFYMLSEEDKADVIKNIDTYSLDDIEAKLSVICVRNKVSFSVEDESEVSPSAVFSLQADMNKGNADCPAWVLEVMKTASELN